MNSKRTPSRRSAVAERQDAEEEAEKSHFNLNWRFSRRLGVPPRRIFDSAFILLLQLAGCAATPDRTIPGTNPSLISFGSAAAGMRFSYPKNWHPAKDDTVLSLVPIAETTMAKNHVVIDMPDLPFHIPFVIPMDPVVSGFEDDLKKRYKDVTESPVVDLVVGGVPGKEVNARARSESGEVVVKAVLLVRGDHVFVIDAETEASKATDAAAAFNTVVESLQWIN